MKNSDRKIEQAVRTGRIRRFMLGISAVLSLIAVIFVTKGLIKPAVSLEDAGGAEYPYTKPGKDWYHFVPDITNVTVDQAKDENGNVVGDSDNDGMINVKFEMYYSLYGEMLKNSNYIYYDLNEDVGGNALISVKTGGYPDSGSLGNVSYGGNVVGTYRVEENGLVVIRFNDEFRESILDVGKDASKTAFLAFSADVSKKNDDDKDDIDLDFNTKDETESDITIPGFKYGPMSLEKTGSVNENGSITWSVKLNNPNGASLKDLILDDKMFANAKDVTCSLDEGMWNYNEESKKLTFGDTTAMDVTVSYVTYPTAGELINGKTYDNEVNLRKPDDTAVKTEKESVRMDSQINITKTAQVEYGIQTGSDNDKIDWTITIDNPTGADMNKFVLKDGAFKNLDADSIKISITDESGNKTEVSGFEIVKPENNWEQPYIKFPEGTEGKKVEVTYTTTPDRTKADGSEYKNEATIATTENDAWKTAGKEVERNQFYLDKGGYTVEGENKIRWTIKLRDNVSDDGMGLDGFVITDEGLLKAIKDGKYDVSMTDGVTYTIQEDGTIMLSVDESKLTPDYQGKRTIDIVYYTDADDEELSTINPDGTYTTLNKVGAEKDKISLEAQKEVTYEKRKSAKKETGRVSLSEDKTKLIVPWRVYFYGDKNVFDGDFVITDSMTSGIKDGSELDFGIKVDSIKLEAIYVGGSNSTLTKDADYTITMSEGDKGFVVSLIDPDNTKFSDVREVRISYESEVSLDGTQSGDIVVFKNTVNANDDEKLTAEKDGTYEVVRDVKLEKQSVYESPINADNLETMKVSIDGKLTDCYIFRWKINLNENGAYNNTGAVITDKLPEGFKVLETDADLYYMSKSGDKGSYSDLIKWQGGGHFEKSESDGVQNLTFNVDSWFAQKGMLTINYAAYIPVRTLDEKLEKGNLEIVNEAKDTNDNVTTSKVSTTVEPGAPKYVLPEDTISKSAKQTLGGYIEYTVEFNPMGLDLVDGKDFITLVDMLNFGSYYYKVNENGEQGELVNASPADLVNMTLDSIKFEKVDSEGKATTLSPTPSYVYTGNPESVTTTVVTMSPATDSDYNGWQWKYDGFSIPGVKNGDEFTVKLSGGEDDAVITEVAVFYKNQYNVKKYLTMESDPKRDSDGNWVCSFIAESNETVTGDVYVLFRKADYLGDYTIATSGTAEITHTEKLGDAELKMDVPDSTHLRITYVYQASSDKIYSMPVTNIVSVDTQYGQAFDSNYSDFVAHDKSEAKVLLELTIGKVDATDTGTKLKAGFILSKYDPQTKKWSYASELQKNEAGHSVVTSWSDIKPTESLFYTSERGAEFVLKLESDQLYYLEELEFPEGYDNTFSDNKYFVYDTDLSKFISSLNSKYFDDADGNKVSVSKINSLLVGNTLNIKNRKKVSIEIEKIWSDGNDKHGDTTVEFGLYRSLTSSDSGDVPEDAVLVEKIQMGGTEGKWTHLWDKLDSVDAYGRKYYYYVKELTSVDGYTPIYDNNGLSGSGGKITVINSKGIFINKVWLDRNSNELKNPPNDISITLYSSTIKSATLPDSENLVKIGDYTLSAAEGWTLQIEGLALKNEEGNTLYYYVVENEVDGFVSSISGNGSGINGNITLTNTLDKLDSVELPATGGNGGMYAMIAGFAVIALAGVVLGIKRKVSKM